MAYIDVEPIIPNTIMQKYINNAGVERTYRITPNEGYVLHDTQYDYPIVDDETMEEIGTGLGYIGAVVTVAINYDFSTHEMLDESGNTVTAYGDRNLYTKLESDVPADSIFGVTEPDHEVM